MLDVYRWVRSPRAEPWLWATIGTVGGLLAVLLLTMQSEVRALVALVALVAGFVCLVNPQIGLYLLVVAAIAQWPGGVIRYAGLAICGSALLWGLARNRSLVPRDSVFYVQLLLTLVVWVSTFRVWGNVDLTIPFAYTSFLALTWSLPMVCDSPRVVRRVIGAMLISGLAIALIGFVQFRYPFVWIVSAAQIDADARAYSGDTALDSLMLDGTLRVESLTGTPNYLALTMLILLPFAVYWTIRQRRPLAVLAGVALTFVLLGAMALSLTRGVLLVTAAVMVPLLVLKIGLRRTLPWLVAAALVSSLAVVAWEPARTRLISTVTEVISADPNTAAGWRREVLPIGWQMFTDHFWAGAGIGQQRSLWRSYASTSIFPAGQETQLPLHNAYLLLGIDLGIIGLVLFITLIVLPWVRMRQAQVHFRATGQQHMLDIAHAAEVAWVAMAVSNMMYPGLDSFRYSWVLLAVMVALGRVMHEQRDGSWEGASVYV